MAAGRDDRADVRYRYKRSAGYVSISACVAEVFFLISACIIGIFFSTFSKITSRAELRDMTERKTEGKMF